MFGDLLTVKSCPWWFLKDCQRWRSGHTRVQKRDHTINQCWANISILFLPGGGVNVERHRGILWFIQEVGRSFIVVLNRWCLYLMEELSEGWKAEWRGDLGVPEAVTMIEGRWNLFKALSSICKPVFEKVKAVSMGDSRRWLVLIVLFLPLLLLDLAILHLGRWAWLSGLRN